MQLFFRERENRIESVLEFDNLGRQLDLLRDANRRLQDTNDGLRTVVDVSAMNSGSSPRIVGRHEFTSLVSGGYGGVGGGGGAHPPPDILRTPSDNEIAERFFARSNRRKVRKKKRSVCGASGSDDFL
jgi:hypothetical protein